MMQSKKLLAALKQLKVETGHLACLGCGYEHDCGIHGCAIIREAVAHIVDLEATHRTEMCEDGYDCTELGKARQALEAEKSKAEENKQQRDAAVRDLEEIMFLGGHNIDTCEYCTCTQCYARGGTQCCNPKWRGLKKE